MTTSRSGGGPDDREPGSWTNETLSLSLRKELLERELRKLGFRKPVAGGGTSTQGGSAAQQQPQDGGSHPQADASGSNHKAG